MPCFFSDLLPRWLAWPLSIWRVKIKSYLARRKSTCPGWLFCPVYLHVHCTYNVLLILSLIWSVGSLLIIKMHFILLVAFSMPTTKKKEPLPGPSRLVNDWPFVINMNCYEDITVCRWALQFYTQIKQLWN